MANVGPVVTYQNPPARDTGGRAALYDRLARYLDNLYRLGTTQLTQRERLSAPASAARNERGVNDTATLLGRLGADVQLPEWYQNRLQQEPIEVRNDYEALAPITPMSLDQGQWEPGSTNTQPAPQVGIREEAADAGTKGGLDLPAFEQIGLGLLNEPAFKPGYTPFPDRPTPTALTLPEPPGERQSVKPREMNMALIETGLRLAASRRPNFLGALAEAGLGGLQRYDTEQQKTETRGEKARDELRRNQAAQLQSSQLENDKYRNDLMAAQLLDQRQTAMAGFDKDRRQAVTSIMSSVAQLRSAQAQYENATNDKLEFKASGNELLAISTRTGNVVRRIPVYAGLPSDVFEAIMKMGTDQALTTGQIDQLLNAEEQRRRVNATQFNRAAALPSIP